MTELAEERRLLPPGFEELEEFLGHWDAPSSQERWTQRAETPYAEIKRFYDAMLARAEHAAVYLDPLDPHNLPEDAARLARLIFALMHASIAVELHQASRVPFSPFPHSIRIERGIAPFG